MGRVLDVFGQGFGQIEHLCVPDELPCHGPLQHVVPTHVQPKVRWIGLVGHVHVDVLDGVVTSGTRRGGSDLEPYGIGPVDQVVGLEILQLGPVGTAVDGIVDVGVPSVLYHRVREVDVANQKGLADGIGHPRALVLGPLIPESDSVAIPVGCGCVSEAVAIEIPGRHVLDVVLRGPALACRQGATLLADEQELLRVTSHGNNDLAIAIEVRYQRPGR